MKNKYTYIFLSMLFFSCKSYPQSKIEDCKILKNPIIIKAVKEQFKVIKSDTLIASNFFIDYKGRGYKILDKKYKWSQQISGDYFDLIIKYFDQSNVILYCPRSGVTAAYKILGKKYHDIYLLDRKTGKIRNSFRSKEGILSIAIIKDIIYFELLDPYRIKYCSASLGANGNNK